MWYLVGSAHMIQLQKNFRTRDELSLALFYSSSVYVFVYVAACSHSAIRWFVRHIFFSFVSASQTKRINILSCTYFGAVLGSYMSSKLLLLFLLHISFSRQKQKSTDIIIGFDGYFWLLLRLVTSFNGLSFHCLLEINKQLSKHHIFSGHWNNVSVSSSAHIYAHRVRTACMRE